MKTQIKRFSKSTLAVVLSICMLISCMTVGLIATDAAKVASESSVSGNLGENHEFGFSTLYVDASNCSNFAKNGYAYSFTPNETGWGTWVNQNATDCGGGVYSFTIDNIWTRCFRLVTKTGSGSPTAAGILMTPPNNNTYNCIVLDSSGEGTWGNYPPLSNVTTTLYVLSGLKDTSNHTMTKAYIWDTGSTVLEAWSGETMATDTDWSSETINGYTYYKREFTNTWSNFQVILNDGTNQTGDSDSYSTGGSVYINEINSSNKAVLSSSPLSTSSYTVTYGIGTGSASGTGTLTASGGISSGDSVTSGTSVTFTAAPGSGQYIEGWYSDSSCTTSLNNGTATTYTTTVSANTSVYVKFSGDITFYVRDAANWGNVAIYLYSGGTPAWPWPGKQILSSGSPVSSSTYSPLTVTTTVESGVYQVTVPGNTANISNIILNNNDAGSQTGDGVALVDGALYITKGSGNDRYTDIVTTGYTPTAVSAETVVYVAKNDNVSNIYAWNTNGDISAPFPGDDFDNSNQVYDIGGIEYYKYTVNTGTKDFNFIVSNGTSGRQSNNAENYAAGHTYYVQWYGTEARVDVKNIGVDWYPEYYLVYKAASAEDVAANWTRVAFSNSTATLSGLTAQDYVFYIVRQDMVSGSKVDNYWYNNGDKIITRSNRTNVYTTHVNGQAPNITLTADTPGDYTVTIDAMNGDTAMTIEAGYPTGYRAVGNATFFGTAWDTSSSSYEYMLTELATPFTDTDSKVYTYSYSKTMNYSVGTFEFKVWDTGDNWHPAGAGTDISVDGGVKRGQTITFYYNPVTGNVTYKITGTADAETWPPSEIQTMMDASGDSQLVVQDTSTHTSQYNTLIYRIASGSNAITESPSTFSPLYQKKVPGETGEWWADLTSLLPTIGTSQLYFNITSNGSYTGFYSTENMTFDTTEAPGITVKKADKDSSKYFVEVSGIESRVTNLGVYITKDASNNFTYKFYTIKGTASASKTVKIYAKDGAIRRLGTARDPRSNITYSTFEQHANTFVYSDSAMTDHIGTRSSTHGASGNDELTDTTVFDRYTYDYAASINKGDTIYIKTLLKNDDYMNQYYLVGYSINGTVNQLHTVAESATGTVSEAFTIPEDWDYNYVEITPIYFFRSGDSIRFYVEGYDQTVMDAGWGNTVGVYPYYQDPTNNDQVANVNNPFGGYPGQPLVFYKGNYYADLPKNYSAYTENSSSAVPCEIKGITLSNMYWDDVHLYTGAVSLHYQTYDFDDLYKIYNEYGNDVDNIICAFKYRNRKNNDEPANMTGWMSSSFENYTNGWELLKNYKGEAIDIFGNVLSDQSAAMAKTFDSSGVVHVVSQDYKSNCAGQYGTEWAVYNTSGTKVVESGGKTTIVPSALAIKSTNNFSNYDAQTRAFKGIYDALAADSNVVGKPVFITYEKSIYGGGDKADRCDARWFFSKKNDPANAKTRIEYSDDLGETWTTDSFTTNTATGSHTGSTAYFTGLSTGADNTPETAAGNTTTTDTSANNNLDPRIGDGYYVFNSTAGEGYKFVGWYILRDNYQSNAPASSYASGTTNFTSHAEIAKDGDIFVARYVKVTTGSFTINHRVHKDSTGFGDVYVQAVVKDSSGNQIGSTYGSTSGANPTSSVTIPSDTDYIANNSGNTIEATFVPDPYGTSEFSNFYATVNDLLQGYNEVDYIKSIEINMPGVDGYDSTKGIYAKVTYDVNRLFSSEGGSPTQTVSSVTHYSKFDLRSDISYSLEYTFKTRYYGNKLYQYSDTYTENELTSYFYDQITTKANTTIQLDNQFVFSKAPFESNYREDLTWVVDNVTFNEPHTAGYLTATQVERKWANATVFDFDNAGTLVTARMAAPYDKLFDASVTTKPSFESTSEETEYINAWSKTTDELYAPLKETYIDTADENKVKPLYIHHWDIYQLDSFTYNTTTPLKVYGDNNELMSLDVDTSKSTLVAQTYSARFNYVGFEDYAIVPVYSKTNFNRQGYSDSRTDSAATLLTITRNHWNANTSSNTLGGSYKDGADRIYVDFMLNYNYILTVNGKAQNTLLSTTGDNIKVGFVVRSYTMNNGERVYSGNSKTVLVNKATIDNKNRVEYCYGFSNSQNNSRWGLMFEFTPFIVDTDSTAQAASAGANIDINGTTYKAMYEVADADILRGVNFYMIGNSDVDWN